MNYPFSLLVSSPFHPDLEVLWNMQSMFKGRKTP